MDINIYFNLFIIAFLLFANAFFVAVEFSFVKVRKTRMEELSKQGNKVADLVLKQLTNLDKVVGVAQFGVTFASIGIGWVGEATISSIIQTMFNDILPPQDAQLIAIHTISSVAAFIFVTFVHVALGEQVPKLISLQNTDETALMVARPTLIVSVIFNPFVKWLETKNVRRSIGTIFSYVIFIGFIILFIQAIIPILYKQTIDLVDNLPNVISDIKSWAENLLKNVDSSTININTIETNLFYRLDIFSKELSMSLPNIIINSATTFISTLGTFIIGLVIGFFLLLSCNKFTDTIVEFIPNKMKDSALELYKRINQSLRGYINGALIDSLVVFVVSSIAFAILGLKSPLLFGLFCGLMNIIPYAGPYIGGTPAVIVGFSQGTGIGIAVLIAIIIIQTIEGNFLQAFIMSKTTKLHPVTIIVGLLIFGHFFGIVGMLVSTPIIGICKVIIKYFDDKYKFLSFN